MPPTPFLIPAWLTLGVVTLGIAGCGAEVYEDRLKANSVPFFGYQRELDTSLGARWKKGDVSIRLPGEFKEVPAPKAKPNAAAGRDPRLPAGFDIELDGILGGFKGTMRAEPSGGKAQDVPVYALVLSNRHLLASKEPTAKPAEFDKRLLSTLAAGLQQGSPAGLRQYVFTDSIESDQRSFAPSHRIEQSSLETTIGGAPMRYEVYVSRQAPLIAAVLFVVPKEAARDERLKKRIDLSLQTLRIESATTGFATGGGSPQAGGAGAPAF